MNEQTKPRNIFEQILYGIGVTNENVVEVSKDIIEMRNEIAEIKAAMLPSVTPDGAEADSDSGNQ